MTGSADRRPVLAGLLALGAAVVLLAGQPAFARDQWFTTGFALRAVAFAVLTGAALFAAWAGPGTRPTLGAASGALLALPLAVAALGLPAFDGTWAGAARAGYTWVLLALWPLALLWTWRTEAEPAQVLRWLVGAGALAAALALVPVIGGGPAIGPFGRTGVAGPVFGALVAPAVFFPPLTHRVRRWAPVLLLAVACLATRSRTGIAAGLVGTALALAVGLAHATARRRMRLATAGVVVLLGGLALLAARGSLARDAGRTIDVRMGLHRASLEALGERPLRGFGLGAYPVIALEHRDLEEARLEPRRRSFHAHLDYLHASVEGGALAGALLLAFVVALGVLGVRGSGPRRQRAAALGIVATLGIAALGDGVLVDPAPVLLLGCAAAILVRRDAQGRPAGVLRQVPLVAGAFLAVALAFVLAKDALADRALMRYRAAIADGVTPAEAEAAARDDLERGALTWRPDLPEALYRLGVHHASLGAYDAARDAWREALRADPGLTEARLDLAQVYELEGRVDDARTVLIEAERRDPTRYDVPRRRMLLALGPEPVPGDPPPEIDEVEVLRWMNKARALAPDRFENKLDEARFERRRARGPDGLARAGELVRAGLAAAPGDPQSPPAEVLLESFRLAEYEAESSDLFKASILLGALRTNPRPARRFEAEAERFLHEGQARETAAVAAASGQPLNADLRAADRAYRAAAIRFTALLYADQIDPVAFLARAQADKAAGMWRAALARYRSLLAWTLPPQQGTKRVGELDAPTRIEVLAREGDLLMEAASVAHHTDKLLAAFYRTRGQLRIGTELLEKGDPAMAEIRLRSALGTDPSLAEAHFGLSRALARQGLEEQAEASLLEALRLKPALKGPALQVPDLAAIRKRAAVRTRLGLP